MNPIFNNKNKLLIKKVFLKFYYKIYKVKELQNGAITNELNIH